MNVRCTLLAGLLALSATHLAAQSAGALHQALSLEAGRLKAFGTDRTLVDFVKAQNARKVSLAEIKRIDAQWIAGAAGSTVHSVTTGTCAEHLRKLFGDQQQYSEVFIMDNQGALVCANGKTTDYWQGDEYKWIRSFNKGAGATFIDRPRFDESAKLNMSQISVPIMDGDKAIGVLMVGVKIDKLIVEK